MNGQQVRLWLQARIEQLDTADLWDVTLSAFPELKSTHTVEIGHSAPSPDTFRRRRMAIPVVWWVNEGNEQAAVADMYTALSFAPDSLIASLLDLEEVRAVEVTDVGPEPFGPTGFVRAQTTVTVVFDDTPTPDDEETS